MPFIHTVDLDEHDGTLMDGCQGCEEISQYPCQWCGYGGAFYTHNPLAHFENDDPSALPEDQWNEQLMTEPYRDWFTYLGNRS